MRAAACGFPCRFPCGFPWVRALRAGAAPVGPVGPVGRWRQQQRAVQAVQAMQAMQSVCLAEADPQVSALIQKEAARQRQSVVLIASEVGKEGEKEGVKRGVTRTLRLVRSWKRWVRRCRTSVNSEGYPGKRYYGGNRYIDEVERLCQERALAVYGLKGEAWGVNVQLSSYFTSIPYKTDPETGLIDYDQLEWLARVVKPKIIIAGITSYSRLLDYARFSKIAKSVNAYLMADISHISGLVAAGVIPSPFEYSDIVTTTTHKSLRGPRGAMIFFRRGIKEQKKNGENVFYDLEDRINSSVFPGHQGGPHNHTISALAVALYQAMTPQFKEYQLQVLKNSKAMSNRFIELGYELLTGGTDTHLMVLDLTKNGIDGASVERVLELVNIDTNKNAVPRDKSPFFPHGLRVGSPAMTTRGLKESDFVTIVEFIHRAINIAKDIQKESGCKHFKEFKEYLGTGETHAELRSLRDEVISWVSKFYIPQKFNRKMINKIELYKLVILGDGAVGKTALTTQTYDPTIEDSYRKQVMIDGQCCILEILDTAGQEEYMALRNQWIKNGDGFLLVYSVSSRLTFDRIKRFREQILQIKDAKLTPLIVIGNKSDRMHDREVSFEEGQSLAHSFGCEYIETSAKSCVNVEFAFHNLVRMIKNSRINEESPNVEKKDKKHIINHIFCRICGIHLETRNYDVYDDSYTSGLSSSESLSSQNIQRGLMECINKLKCELVNKDRDKEELFRNYENLQEEHNNLLLSYKSLQASSSKQLADLKAQLLSLTSEMDRNMDYAREELEIKTQCLNKMKQKLEKFRSANLMANKHIETLQANFDIERGRWKEEKIRLCSNKYSTRKMEELEELTLLHKQYENMRFEVIETRENSACVSSSSSINTKYENIITNSSDNLCFNKTLATELGLFFDTEQRSNSEVFQLKDFLDESSSELSKTRLTCESQESIVIIPEEHVEYDSKDIIDPDISVSIVKHEEAGNNSVVSSIYSIQTETISENVMMSNKVQENIADSLNFGNTNLLECKKSIKDSLKGKKHTVSLETSFLKYQYSNICPPLPIPVRKTSLVFKEASTVPFDTFNPTLKVS
ncbi:hypothetical protein PORY_001829 [Pneumocystis oryctolagi]|uniref:Uncharacterized protein n=1 Tax=Pneumocystis oryctolagi TaxID=42067 RepID=A0ACB7CAZ4_9ASCO|nr:hypothetical protein PORY_001829 [Pneumocystis oryctolagi]